MSAPVDDDLRRRQRAEWWVLGLLLLAAVLLVAALRWNAHEAIERNERERLDGQARAVQGILARQLESAHAALVAVAEDAGSWTAETVAATASRRLKALCDAIPGLAMVALLAPDGHVLASSRLTLIGAALEARLPAVAPGTLHVSPPFRDASGGLSIGLSLPVAPLQGGGAIVATLDAEYFRVVLRSMLYAADMRGGLAHGNGEVLMFEPPQRGDEALNVARPGSLFLRHRASGRDDNIFSGVVQSTGDERLVAIRNLRPPRVPMDAPLVLSVSRELDAVFAPWRQQSWWAAGLCVVFATGLALALALLQQRQRVLRTLQVDNAAREHAEAERLALALRGADLALWDNDMRTGVGTVNDRWCEMLGLRRGEVPTSDEAWRALVHPDDRARVFAALQAHVDGRSEAYEAVYRLRHRDGHWIWVLDRGKVLERGPEGEPLRMVGTHMDISARMEAEQALRDSEAKKRMLVDNLTVGIVVHGPDGQVLEANPAACRLVGLTVEQMRGQAPADPGWQAVEEDGRLLAPARLPAAQVIASGQPLVNLVMGIVRPELGSTVWLLCSAFPVRRADGAIDQILVTALDITERRQAELERQVLERQLRESQRMESIGTLAGGIAHDFNNILAAILGNVALARQDATPGHPVQASLAQIHQAGLRARSLVQQILAFSRRDPGALVVQPLRGVIEETLSLLRATLPATVRVEARLGDALVRADATQLQQVLMNLATNAWHALPPSGGLIEIGSERIGAAAAARLPGPALAPGPAVHLWVRDNGIGMDGATRSRIFDPFFTTKPVGQGTGLGLSVVHGIVRAHQGLITVDSEPGRGSTFHLYFPVPEPAAPAAPALPAAAPGDGPDDEDDGGGRGRHVLVVDDDEVVVLRAERLLQRAGYRVSTSPGGADALARVQAAPAAFDIVVSDFNMPELSGIELAQRLAVLRPGLPVVLSSGLVSEALREQAREAGVRALLNKENSFDELAATVERVLASSPVTTGR